MNNAVQTFLLSLSALFSIVNPIGGAMMFSQMTASMSPGDRLVLARRVALYSAVVMLATLWTGHVILEFFGISLAALRIGGGLVAMSSAWSLLQAPDRHEGREEAANEKSPDMAFFPLTLPLTTGPGTISVTIALASSAPAGRVDMIAALAAISGAAITVALAVWALYSTADRISLLLGPARANIVARLAAFVLLCVGVQIMLAGIEDFIKTMPTK